MQAAMDQRIRVRPKADESRCTGCGTCVDQCPASALSMEDALPRVDPEACIGCFCCQELCPERAMALS
jgi:ferredoxin